MGSDSLEDEMDTKLRETVAQRILKTGVLGFRSVGSNKYGNQQYETWNKISDGKTPYRKKEKKNA